MAPLRGAWQGVAQASVFFGGYQELRSSPRPWWSVAAWRARSRADAQRFSSVGSQGANSSRSGSGNLSRVRFVYPPRDVGSPAGFDVLPVSAVFDQDRGVARPHLRRAPVYQPRRSSGSARCVVRMRFSFQGSRRPWVRPHPIVRCSMRVGWTAGQQHLRRLITWRSTAHNHFHCVET